MPLKIVKCGLTTSVSHLYIEDIKYHLKHNKSGELILMVPDRFSYLAEKNICESIGGLGFGGVKVLTLHQLIRRISSQQDALSSVGKQMLLRRIINKCLSEDSVFYGAKDRAGFVENVLEVMNDWKNFCITVSDMEAELARADESLTKKKLADLTNIYSEYIDEFEENGYKDEADLLECASRIITETDEYNNSVLWIDGFVEFVPAQMNILMAFLSKGAEVTVFLPCPKSRTPDRTDVYSVPYNTMLNLCDMCKNHGFSYTVEEAFQKKKLADEIEFLCETYDSREEIYNKPCKSITITKSDDIYSEVEHAASKIIDLVCDDGYEFSDISLLCGNLSGYASCIEAVFERYSIPYFSDYKVPLSSHPVSILLMSIFDILENKSFAPGCVTRYLKTGYVIKSPDDIDYLSHFIQKRGIRGSMWTDEKYFTIDTGGFLDEAVGRKPKAIYNSKKLLELRSAVTEPLLDYWEKSGGKRTVKEHVQALFDYFKTIHLFEKIQATVEEFEKAGDENEASRLTHVWNILVNLFDQMVLALGDEKVGRSTFGEYLKAGIEGSEISIIPSVTNGVTVSDAGHRKGADVKALFILGATQSTVPAVKKDDVLITEQELEMFSVLPTSVGKTGRNLSKEFELLTAFSETSDFLYISNCIIGSGGEKEDDSSVFDLLKNKFSTISIVKPDDNLFISSPETMLHKLLVKIASGQELTGYYKCIRDWFYQKDPESAGFKLLDEAEKYKILVGSIPKNLSSELYKNLTEYSVSRLEKYFQCPFKYFLNFGLNLEDEEVYGMKSTDTGNAVHHVLALFCEEVEGGAKTREEKRARWEAMTNEKANEIVSKILSGIMEKSDSVKEDDLKMQSVFKRLESTAKKAAELIVLMLVKGKYEIYGNELPFESLKLSGSKGDVSFHGVIDRLDVFEEDGKVSVRIVDYKTGEKDFDFVHALNGVDLQLLVYALAGAELAGDDSEVAGFFYNSLKKRMVSSDDLEKSETELKKQFKLSGSIVEDSDALGLETKTGLDMDRDLDVLGESSFLPLKLKKDKRYYAASSAVSREMIKEVLNSIKETASNAAFEIENGDVRVYPYKNKKKDSCSYCPYSTICMYDICNGAQINNGEQGKEELKEIKNRLGG